MKYKSVRFDASYEGQFRTPLFELAGGNAELLSALYSSIAPRWPIAANDMQGFGAATIGDMRVRVGLFRGHGAIEVTAEKFVASFTGAVGPQDLDIVTDATALALTGFESWARDKESWSPNPSFQQEIIRFTQNLDLVASADEVTRFFENLVRTRERFDPVNYGGNDVRGSCRIEVTAAADAWRLVLNLERAWGPATTSALLMVDGTFSPSTSHTTLLQKRSFIEASILRFLADVGLVPQDDLSKD